MRRSYIGFALLAFAVACSDSPTGPQLAANDPSFAKAPGYPPPPYEQVDAYMEANGEAFVVSGHYFANKPGTNAWLRFTEGQGGATVSPNARIQAQKGDVSGRGTITTPLGQTIDLSTVQTFNARGDCLDGCGSFSGPGYNAFINSKRGGEIECGLDVACTGGF